MVGQGQTVEA